MRCLNLRNDRLVGATINKVLKDRYPPSTYKTEYYNLIDLGVKLQAMCVVIKESPFTKAQHYRDETVKMIDKAFQQMEV